MPGLTLKALARFEDFSWLLLRAVTGAFLIYGTWDNITSAERMREFVLFLEKFGFFAPRFMAPLSVWVQFVAGLALAAGLFVRAAGLLIAVNFVVAVAMVHWAQDFRGWWPALVLVFIGLHALARGAGAYGLDALLERRTKVMTG